MQRDSYIDFLRTFGLLLLVVAHTMPPKWAFILRSFDVPLMVFISGMCYKPLRGGYLTYCKKRFTRIYRPVLVFLSLYFCIEYLSHLFFNTKMASFFNIIGSYLLLNSPSIGYVWIMRVFLLVALLSPLFYKIAARIRPNHFILIIVFMLVVQQLLINSIEHISYSWLRYIVELIIPYVFGYGIISFAGMKVRDLRKNDIITLFFAILSIALMFIMIYRLFHLPLPFNKYPPKILFLTYGLSASLVLWYVKPFLSRFCNHSWIIFLSKNSMWIYLWHILGVNLAKHIPYVHNHWFSRYFFVLTIAVLLTILYNHIVCKLSRIKQSYTS